MPERGSRSIDVPLQMRTAKDWEARIKASGIALDIPPRFLGANSGFPDKKGDRLTGLPKIDTDRNRTTLARRLGEAVLDNEQFAVLYSDLDNLKVANNISHLFGDQMIRAGAADISNSLAAIEWEGATIFVARAGGAADETVAWVFGINNTQKSAIDELVSKLNAGKATYHEDGGMVPDFDVAHSVAVVHSDDPLFKTALADTKRFLTPDPTKPSPRKPRLPRDLFDQFTNYADDKAKLIKVGKDIRRLDLDNLVATTEASQGGDKVKTVKKLLKESLGGTRISAPLFAAALEMVDHERIMHVISIDQTKILNEKKIPMSEQATIIDGRLIDYMSSVMNMDPEHFHDAGFTLTDIRVAFLDYLLHEEYKSGNYH